MAYRLGVDVGGTFTDAVLVDAGGATHSAKVPSTPSEESTAVLQAVEEVLAHAGAQPRQVERFAHGMTVATNARPGQLRRTVDRERKIHRAPTPSLLNLTILNQI